MTIKHAFVSPKSDVADDTLVRPSNWNANHTVDLSIISLINLLSGGDYEVGDPPTGWTLGAGTLSRSTTQVKIGSYSAKLVSGAGNAWFNQSIPNYAYYKGRKVTAGIWLWADVAGKTRLNIYDGVGSSPSDYHPGDSAWHWITTPLLVDAAATDVRPQVEILTGVATTCYADGAILVEGDSCPAFAPKPDEALINHHTAGYTISVYETGFVLHTNLGAGAAIVITLPQTVSAGFTCRFAVMAAQALRIDPGAAGAIYVNGAKQTDDKYIWADDEAESVVLTADGNGDWIASSVVGTWGVEE